MLPAAITHDFRDFDADDSSAQIHEVIPPTDEELEAGAERDWQDALAIFTAPQRNKGAR